MTTKAPLQWNCQETEAAFTSFKRIPAAQVETFSNEEVA